MNKKDGENFLKGYILLWVLVIVISAFVIITHVVFQVGNGRWECSEYKEYEIRKCPDNIDEPCSVSQIKECVKEVWTRNVVEDE